MIETLLSSLGVLLTPKLVDGLMIGSTYNLSMVSTFLADRGAMLGIIVLITVLFNIMRALRFCRTKEGKFKSAGIVYGIKKGLLCGIVALIGLLVISFIPILRVPFTVIGFIPGLSTYIDGFIMSVLYFITYITVAYPIWGAC